jgi:hypothetical protein
MKRLLGTGALLVIACGALSSCSNVGTTTSASSEAAPARIASSGPRHRAAHVSYTRCDQNISAGPHTTCGFADNVFRAFAREVSREGGERADYSVEASSPATGHTYSMSCTTSGETTVCEGADHARVLFPLSAAEVYYQASTPAPESTPGDEGDEYGEGPEEVEPSSSEPGECTNGTYVNSAGNTVCSPEESPTQPAGATAECEDGTYSFSESRSGTCSHHGGVAQWLQ